MSEFIRDYELKQVCDLRHDQTARVWVDYTRLYPTQIYEYSDWASARQEFFDMLDRQRDYEPTYRQVDPSEVQFELFVSSDFPGKDAMTVKSDYPQCRTCKHWRERGAKTGWCDEIGRDEFPQPIDDWLAVITGEDIHSPFLVTKPDFGCALHEPKEQTQ